jgi:tetratricopeptide (TPR) repeat protein
VMHQMAKVLVASGDVAGAELAIDRALASYRRQGDAYGEGRALLSRIEVFEARGDVAEAMRSAASALALAEQRGLGQLQVLARIELGRLELAAGFTASGLDSLRKALGEAILVGDRHAQFVAHFHMWKAHEKAGDEERARLELDAATYFVRFVDDQSRESMEIHRRLREKASPS